MSKIRDMRRALRACVGKPVGYQIQDGYGASIAPVLEEIIRGRRINDRDVVAALASDDVEYDARNQVAASLAGPMIIPAGKSGKATALVSVRGVALYDAEYQPFCFSTLLLSQTIASLANDPEIGTIVLDIDSPGGSTTGVEEAANAVFNARKGANVVALVSPLCASAAYHIASQANEITAVPSADIGSVGVFMLHTDCSKAMEEAGVKPTFIFAKGSPYKVEGNSYEPLSEEAKAHYQSEVDNVMSAMVKNIARGRGVSVAKVLADFGQGRTMMAPAALSAGMIDRVATINVAMARWGISSATLEGRRRGEGLAPETAADAGDAGLIVSDGAGTIDAAAAPAGDDPAEELFSDIAAVADYATVGGPPENWNEITVVNTETGEEVVDIVEVNAPEGWAVINCISQNGHRIVFNGQPVTKRIEGDFKIILKADLPEGTQVADNAGMFTEEIQQHKYTQRRRQIELHRWG